MPALVIEDDLRIISERSQRLLHVDVIEPRAAVDRDQGRALRDPLTLRKQRRARRVEPQPNATQIEQQSDLRWLTTLDSITPASHGRCVTQLYGSEGRTTEQCRSRRTHPYAVLSLPSMTLLVLARPRGVTHAP
jgi:hypothetical protein